MAYVRNCSLHLNQNNQKCTNHKGTEQKFTKIWLRIPASSVCIKQVYEVYFRTLSSMKQGRKKMFISR